MTKHQQLFEDGVALLQRGNLYQAVQKFTKALVENRLFVNAYVNRGAALAMLNKYDEAVSDFTKALVLNPKEHLADIYCNRGAALIKLNRYEEAIADLDRCLQLQPDHFLAIKNRILVLEKMNRLVDALTACNAALEFHPDDLDLQYLQAILNFSTMRLDDAEQILSHILEINGRFNKANWTRSHVRLMKGEYIEGWKEYESRMEVFDYPTVNAHIPQWNGEDLTGKTIFIFSEQGMGDTLHFCRYLKLFDTKKTRVIVGVPVMLKDVITDSFPGVEVVTDGRHIADVDYCRMLMSLPMVFKTTVETIPYPQGYLNVAQSRIEYWGEKMGWLQERPRIGLVWSGGYRANQPELFSINERRNIPLTMFDRLVDVDADFYSLQIGVGTKDQAKQSMLNLIDFTDNITSFADTAAIIMNLDLVISVDTAVVHLAGGLGKPVWLLNRYDTCWRWMVDTNTSPWYNSLRIFRQPKFLDWDSVINDVHKELAK